MPKKIIDSATGEEVEVFSPQEVEEQRVQAQEKAIEDYKKDHPDNATEIERLQAELEKTTKELEGEKSKDKNFSALRKAKEELQTQLDAAIGGVRKDLLDRDLASAIASISGGDEEYGKKVKLHFETTLSAVPSKTPEEFAKKLEQATVLAGGGTAAGPRGNAFSSGGAGGARPTPKGATISSAAEEVLRKMDPSITPEEIKKYDKQDFSTTE